jgi:hypothetical protein
MTVSDFFKAYSFQNLGNGIWLHVNQSHTVLWVNDNFHFVVEGMHKMEKADNICADFLHYDIIRRMLRKQYSPEVSNREIHQMANFLAEAHQTFPTEGQIHEAWVKLMNGELDPATK